MTNLSPAALAVWAQYCGIIEEHGPARLGLAAALRAAADHCDPEWTALTCLHSIHAIADELEGIKYGTYRCDLKAQ